MLISWTGTQRPKHERSPLWYIIAGSITAILLAYSIWTGAWTFTIVIVLTTGVYLAMHRIQPEEISVTVAEHGLLYGNTFIPWLDLSAYWILQAHNHSEIHFEWRKPKKKELCISTGNADILTLRQTLHSFLAERHDKNERLLDTISRVCKL